MAIIVLILASLLTPARVGAAFEFKRPGARAAGLGGAFSSASAGAAALYWNPAGLHGRTGREADAFYARIFSSRDLVYYGSSFLFPADRFAVGLGFSRFGNPAYREQELLAGFALALTPRVLLGGTLKGLFLAIDGYGQAAAWGLDGGMIWRPLDRVQVGVVGRNLNAPALASSGERLRRTWTAAVHCTVLRGVRIMAECDPPGFQGSTCRSGMEMNVAGRLSLRSGLGGRPAQYCAGFGVAGHSAALDYGYAQSSDLPATHQISLRLMLGE